MTNDPNKTGTVLLNIDKYLKKADNPAITELFDNQGMEMARRIFGEGLTPYDNTDLVAKAERINVAVMMLADLVEE